MTNIEPVLAVWAGWAPVFWWLFCALMAIQLAKRLLKEAGITK